MSKTSLPIGHMQNNRVISLDLASLVDTRCLIQANSGGGKSYLLRLLAERAAGKIQMIILDPEGEFATLREKVDIALVGQGGEMATDVRAAALLARKLVELSVSAIVDLYELKLPDRRKFVRLFLESLMSAPRSYWHPLLIVLDECHIFAPERSAGEAESTGAVISLMSQGRKRGFAGILSTQRLSKLHKDAAAESNNIVIGRTWLDVDQQRAGDLLGMNKQDRQGLRDLVPGEFFAFGPAINIGGVIRFRSDQVMTTHPKAGERYLMEVPQASAAIQEVVRQIGDLPAQAEEEARTLESLQRENLDLKRQLRARPVAVEQKVETKIERIEVPVFDPGQIEAFSSALKDINKASDQFGSHLKDLGLSLDSALRIAEKSILKMSEVKISRELPNRMAAQVPPRAVSSRETGVTAKLQISEGLTRPQQSILDTLANLERLGVQQPADRFNVAVFSDQSPKSSGFFNNLASLRNKGFIEYAGKGLLGLTENGRLQANMKQSIQTLSGLHEAWFKKISPQKAEILRVLIEIYPTEITKEELAERSGQRVTSSGYLNNLGNLRSLGLVKYPRSGTVAATDLLFPSGLR